MNPFRRLLNTLQLKKEAPTKITAKEFLAMIREKPSVFKHWDIPLEITEYVDCKFSEITHLSPHLTFSGRDATGHSASFAGCIKLQVATGTFHGNVTFHGSGIERIENLTITQPNYEKEAANFGFCQQLKVATGTFHGMVNFSTSGIETIQNLIITKPDIHGTAAYFTKCPNLKVATGTYPGTVFFNNSRVERIENLNIHPPDKDAYFAGFYGCANLHTLEGLDISQKINIEPEKLEAEKARRSALKKFIAGTTPNNLPFL
jgi:hypothetical protein